MNYREYTNDELVSIAPSIGATRPIDEVSSKYTFVSTLDAVDIIRDNGWKPVKVAEVKSRGERKGFQKHMIRFTQNNMLAENERFDVVLNNSHDRGCAFNLMAGIFRMVCSNGLIIGDKSLEFSHKHINFSAEDFCVSIGEISNSANLIEKRVTDFKQIELSPVESITYAESANHIRWGEESPIEPSKILSPRRTQDMKPDLWTTYNRVQENIMKGGHSYVRRDANNNLRRGTTRKIKAIDKDIKLNKALWMLTEKMADLKKNGIVYNAGLRS